MHRSPPVFSRDQLVAVEARQIDERGRAARGEAVAVLAVLREEARAEAERDRQAAGAEAEHIAGIGRGFVVGGAGGSARPCRLASDARPRRSMRAAARSRRRVCRW